MVSMKKEPQEINTRLVQAVAVQEVQNSALELTVPITGKLRANRRMDLFAEVSGVLQRNAKPFKEGTAFTAGEVLLDMDDREARNNLLAQKSQLLNSVTQALPDLQLDYPSSYKRWQDWTNAFNLNQPLPELPEPANQQERFFISARNIPNLYYNIKSAEVRLSKYRVLAPFSGVLANVTIDEGALVRGGQKLGELTQPGIFELEAAISVQQAARTNVGDTVALTSPDVPGQWTGRVVRMSNQLNQSTQSVQVFVQVESDRLREGMYLEGSIRTSREPNVLSISRSLLHNNQVFVVEQDSLLRTHPVNVVQFTEDQAIVSGLQNGQKLVTTNVAGAYDGMVVVIR